MNKIITFFRESALARFLIPMGFFVAIFGIIILIININNSDYIKTTATVKRVALENEAYTDVDGTYYEATYKVALKYVVDGKEYDAELGGLSKRNIGDKMTIYYNPSDPSQITQTKSLILPIALIIGGAVAFGCGIVSGINAIKRIKKMNEQEKEWANGN